MDKFEQWFINQDFYTNMRFIHGDALFIKDGDIYRVLPVQMVWVAWQSRQAEVDRLKEAIEHQGKLAIQAMNEAHKGSRLELSIAEDIQANLKPELIESERQMNAQLTEENMKLEAELDEKDKRIDELSNLLDRSEINHKHLLTKYQSTKLMEMESSKRLSVIETLIESWRDLKIKGIASEHRAYEDALNKCADELEKALRGDNA